MKNLKIIDKSNLIDNVNHFKNKKICAMVKSNAYGHGLAEIVKILNRNVDYFGVVSVEEGIKVRKVSDKPILICSRVDNLKACKQYDLEVIAEDENDLNTFFKAGLKDSCHLKINSGMNRYGLKSVLSAKMVNEFLIEKEITLKSICSHFSMTESRRATNMAYRRFTKLRSLIAQDSLICFGGGNIYNYPFDFDMVRVGVGLYGYGQKGLKPVMKIVSHVSKILYAKKGEYIGYGQNYNLTKNEIFAVVPLGYGDGLRRNLSGNFRVIINGKKYASVGNICMDAFFVKVDKSVKVGDEVVVMNDAQYMAKKLETISYEVLTGFSNLRGDTIVK
ncbi:MAG: alanine racemase [Clostridia bacterium]|nr:alanine racemase [Clostridia bacterium]